MLLQEVFNKATEFTVKTSGGTIDATFTIDEYTYEVSLVPSWPKSKQGIEFFNNKIGERPDRDDREGWMEYTRHKNESQKNYPCYILSFKIVDGLSDDQLDQMEVRARENNPGEAIDDGDEEAQFERSNTGNQFIVFSTIFKILQKAISIRDSKGGMILEIGFSGKGESRNSLYGKMIDKYADKIGFSSNTKGLSKYVTHDQKFLIINKKIM